jgi:hypothetical protein
MKTLSAVGAAALVGGLMTVGPVSSAVLDANPFSLANFCAVDGSGDPLNSYRQGFFTYTCYTGGPSQTGANAPMPAAAHMAVNTLSTSAGVNISSASLSGVETGIFNINSLGTQNTGSISYYIDLTPPPGFTVDDTPDLRFTLIRLTNELLDQNSGNVNTRKQITGQNTTIVPNATFTADLNLGDTPPSAQTNCGVCRRFAVTDSYNADVNGGGTGDAGRVISMTNTYEVALPIPAPLALIAVGLLGVGFASRRRQS